MSATEAQTFADRGWQRWVGVTTALTEIENGLTLIGTSGGDTLTGLAGPDDIYSKSGNDTLTGGAGDDDFIFFAAETGAKVITDFDVGDRIVLSGEGFPPVASILSSVDKAYIYTLDNGLSVKTHVQLNESDFVPE